MELDDDEREAFAYIQYKPENPTNLPAGFVFAVSDVYDRRRNEALSPGFLCSKIIDRCMSEQASYRTLGMDPSEYYYPPEFVEHRDRLMKKARQHVQAAPSSTGVRA